MITLLLLACLGAPAAVVLLAVALVANHQHRQPATRYGTRVWVPGYYTRRGKYVRGYYTRR